MANDSASAGQGPLTDTMSPGKRKRLQQCFERANELARKDKPDFDYAHDLYAQAVLNDPGNLVYVEAMLGNLQRKFNNNKKGRAFGFGGKKAFKEAVSEEDWSDIFREGLELLKSNPWDTHVLRELARACAFNRYNEVELRYLKNALDGKPKDADVNRHCAQSLARMGQFDMAIACWNRVAEKSKSDEAEKMISELTLAKTMGVAISFEAIGAVGHRPMAPKPSGKPPTPTDLDSEALGKDVDLPAAEPNPPRADETDPRREIKLNERQRLEKAIREDPGEMENYFQLAEIHSQERRYADAEAVLGRAIEAVGPSLKLQSALEDTQIRSAKARAAIAEQRAANAKTDEARQLATQLRDELNRLELDIYQQRCQRYPDRLRNRRELGVRLRRAGNYLEAIKAFDAARKDPHYEVAATLEMGECWQQLKQYAKALKCYQLAIQKSSERDGDRQKWALYRGGVLAAALKQPEQAKSWLATLLQIDPQFKDASARLDRLG